MKTLILILSILLTTPIFARYIDDIIYNGTDELSEIELSSVYSDRSGVPRYQVETTARLHFEEGSRQLGKDVTITVAQNQLDLAMEASDDNNVLALLKFKSSNRDNYGNTWSVVMDVDVMFIDDRNRLMNPYRGNINDMMMIDDYLSFTIARMDIPTGFTPSVKIVRMKTLRSDEVLLEQEFGEKDWVVTEFGRDRSLITIDLAKHLRQIERGKKHEVSVVIKPSFGKWRPFTKGSKEILSNLPSSKVETTFRYSLN